ncbi:pre-mRNA-splicing factor CWC22 homolog [Aphidius gifuensis]|uniref:pre-mRNA-splicing factor CWC22 homolog n=1 Tax=Aphidius gifuensis TaxID=684658 RepID=UPI001CDC38C1|nr:pre-mRNA-splicing factor CWC22 homolog [Aphidius gifuensis]
MPFVGDHCKNLASLECEFDDDLLTHNAGHFVQAFTHEESIIAISNNCKKLKRLEIPRCIIVPSIDGEPLSSPSVLDELSKLQCLEHLNLSHSKNLQDSTIIAIANHCKNLKSLDIQCCTSLTETALVALTNFKNLQKLNVNHINTITDSFIIKLKGLKELHCNQCKKLTNAGVIQLIKNNPDLELLDVYYIDNITIDLIIAADQATKNRFSVDELTLQEISEATTLVHLDIELYDKHIGFPLFDKLDNLEYIKIESKAKNIRDRDVSTKVANTIFRKCKNLKHVDIANDFCDLTKIPLTKWKNSKNLEYLTLSCYEVLPDLADTIVKYCKNLKHLCVNPVCDDIEANVVKKLTKLENLEGLEMSAANFSEEAIIAISKNCKKLKLLEIEGCTILSTGIDGEPPSSPSVLNELSKLQYLEHLNLNYTDNIEDNTIIAIANNCKNLKSLHIYNDRDNITETAFVALTKLENLEILNVGSRNITDSFIISLKGLKELHCAHCKNLTDTGIIQFIKNNPDLEKINICYTKNITIDMVIGADQATKNRTNEYPNHENDYSPPASEESLPEYRRSSPSRKRRYSPYYNKSEFTGLTYWESNRHKSRRYSDDDTDNYVIGKRFYGGESKHSSRKDGKHDTESEKKDPSVIPPSQKRTVDLLTSKTGGAYIPPAKLRLMQSHINDKSGAAFQRISWEALKKSIHGHINKVNTSNIGLIVRELLRENIIRGRGLLTRSIIQAQAASPTFTPIYAALVSVINSKFRDIGELLLSRLVNQFQRAFRLNNKPLCISSGTFIAHLVNQKVANEIIALDLLELLVGSPTDDSVEVAIALLKECGMRLTEVSKKCVDIIFNMLRDILHKGNLDKRVQYMIEVIFEVRKDGFKDHQAVPEELDLIEEKDQTTHVISLEETVDSKDVLNVFKFDFDYITNENKYKELSNKLLGLDDESGSDGDDDDNDKDLDTENSDEENKSKEGVIIDSTETNLQTLRRTIYLTIYSSVSPDECTHKLLKMQMKLGQEIELCHMILDCCAEMRTYEKFVGLLAGRFCAINKIYKSSFEKIFKNSYETIHRLDMNKLRNLSKFFAHLLYTDSISWGVLNCIKLNEEDTTSSSRIFIKILFQELSEIMELPKLNARVKDVTLQDAFDGLFPRDDPKNTRFAINFFTSIGLGGLTDDLREHLKTKPKTVIHTNIKASSSSSSSSSSSLSSSDSSSS